MRRSVIPVSLLVGVCAIACGANDNDPDFWTEGHDLGGPGFGVPPATGGESGVGGNSGNGGWVTTTGGAPVGNGGFIASTGGSVGNGGFISGTGGFISSTGGLPPSTGGSTASTPCTVTFTVTTGPGTGQYQPDNVTAMWISNAQGAFVKTLEVRGTIRVGNLTKWGATGSNIVDAVTGATLPNHTQHVGTWNCTDVNRNVVVDGQYQVNMEWTDDNSAIFFYPPSRIFTLGFTKGAGPQTLTAPSATGFSGISLTVQ